MIIVTAQCISLRKHILRSSCSDNNTWMVDKPTCRQGGITGARKLRKDLYHVCIEMLNFEVQDTLIAYGDWKIQGIEFNNE